jgi:hypothetical protein
MRRYIPRRGKLLVIGIDREDGDRDIKTVSYPPGSFKAVDLPK